MCYYPLGGKELEGACSRKVDDPRGKKEATGLYQPKRTAREETIIDVCIGRERETERGKGK
jgi:hypothetical protein